MKFARGDIIYYNSNGKRFIGLIIHALDSEQGQTVFWCVNGKKYGTFPSEKVADIGAVILGRIVDLTSETPELQLNYA